MLRGRDVQDFGELKRQGLSICAISRLTGYCRKTVRKYLIQPNDVPVYGPRPKQPGKLDPFQPYLEDRMRAGVWNARVLLREMRERFSSIEYRRHLSVGGASRNAGSMVTWAELLIILSVASPPQA